MWTYIEKYVEFPYLIVFVLLAYAFKNVFASGLQKVIPKLPNMKTYAVFIIASVVAIPFWFWTDPLKLLVTYAVGTSMYDLLIDVIVNAVKQVGKIADKEKEQSDGSENP